MPDFKAKGSLDSSVTASEPEASAMPKKTPAHSRHHQDKKSATYRVYRIERSLLGAHIPETIDRMVNANLARVTSGVSPAVLAMAYLDWLMHLGLSPGKQALLNEKALRKMVRLALYAFKSSQQPDIPPCIEPLPQDHRFDNDSWRQWPYNLIYQSFLLNQQWWYNATTHIRGVDPRNDAIVSFITRQVLDMFSPSNLPLTNPEILKATLEEGGQNLVRGWTNFMADMDKIIAGKRLTEGDEPFIVGRDVAVTPGKVIFRNHLMELIQYQPMTEQVYAEPVLIVPAWIMKYYILDLSPDNSMVRYLVEKGHTVFMISWKNPTADDRDIGMSDYRRHGVMAALNAITAILPDRVHAVGYCLGGTLLTLTAAAMARNGDHRLKTMSLFAAQTDFSEAGELLLFINESQVSFLEDMMWDQGYLDAGQMVGAFQLLRSNDLIWSRMVHDYLLGQRQPLNDLMAWNADQTRMPFRMHSEYLRHIFLGNELATGHYKVDGRPIAISDIRVPIFTVATEQDHVAPWRSVYKINLLADTEQLTFVLTSGGHNAGIVSEPGHSRRSYQIAGRNDEDRCYIDPETWQATTPKQSGSWWPAWQTWLAEHSEEQSVELPSMGMPSKGFYPIDDAPGQYVLQK